jgi:serine/threonine-protein kinase
VAARFGKYRLIRRLAVGGAGEVLLATDGQREVALKRLLHHLKDPAAAATFRTEARLASLSQHPNLVEVFEAGVLDGTPFIAMEYVDGLDLHQLLGRLQDRPPGLGAFVAREVCRALDHLHTAVDQDRRPLGLVHRDVSPANVLVGRRGCVKLGDLGVARVVVETSGARTAPGAIKGKLEYLSPEQARGDAVLASSDLFAVGTILYQALAGTSPFAAPSDGEVLERVRAAQVPPPSRSRPDVPPALERVCLRALERLPAARFSSAGAMAAALDPIVESLGFGCGELAALVLAVDPPRPSTSADPTRTLVSLPRRVAPWLLIAAGLLGGWGVWHRTRPVPAPVVGEPASSRSPARAPVPAAPPPQPAPQTPKVATRAIARERHPSPLRTKPSGRAPAERTNAGKARDLMPNPFVH